MGYEDRDYMQNHGGGGSGIMPGYPACRFLIIATIVCFVLQIFSAREPTEAELEKRYRQIVEEYVLDIQADPELDLTEAEQRELASQEAARMLSGTAKVSVVQEWLQLETDKVLRGQVWRLVTTAFLHDRHGVWHILINMLLLFWFGRALEDMYGHREFLAMYLTAAVVASVAFVALELLVGERFPAIGASGAVMAVLCLYAIYHPTDTIRFMFVLPIQIRYLVWIYAIYDLHPVLLKLSGAQVLTGTAHAAHLGGLLFGYLYYRYGWTLEPVVNPILSLFQRRGEGGRNSQLRTESGRSFENSQKDRTNQNKPRANTKRVQRLEENLDSILQKISEQGEGSLTVRERKVLEEASKHYRSQNKS